MKTKLHLPSTISGSIISVAGVLLLAAALGGCGSSSNNATPPPQVFTQFDRLARPAVNEVFATAEANPNVPSPGNIGRHEVNDEDNPTDDAGQLAKDIDDFMTTAAGRPTLSPVIKAVLVPDVLKANLNQPAPAAYLGVETNGATGGTFGGRKLTDDVVDISLGVIFGSTLTTAPGGLGLVPDDGKEIPALTSDNVDAHTAPKHFQDGSPGFAAASFPYLGPPQ